MQLTKRIATAVPALPVAGALFIASQVLRAAHRSDLPSYPNQDPSGVFGDPEAPNLRVVAVGDSSITAPGVESLDNTWIRRITRRHSDTHCVELVCLAVGGSKARDVVEGQLGEAVRLQPDVAVVSVGANDVIRTLSSKRYERDLTTIVDALREVTGAIIVLGVGDLGSIPRLPKSIKPLLTRQAASFDRVARRVALARPHTIKGHTGGRISTAFYDDPSLFAGDQFHAGDSGHGVFAEELAPAFDAAVAIALARREPRLSEK